MVWNVGGGCLPVFTCAGVFDDSFEIQAGKMLLVTLSLGASAHLAAAEPAADKPLAQAVSALHQGDPQAAHDKLSEIIASGTSDARVFYYHGLASEALGQDGTDDLPPGQNWKSRRAQRGS